MIKGILKRIPGVQEFAQSRIYQSYRHGVALRTAPRVNSNFTGFWRLPTQFQALSGPVADHLIAVAPGRQLRIASIGCSNGAEAYTVSSCLSNHRPGLQYSIHAIDIHQHVIDKARAASYEPEEEVYCNRRITEEFIDQTFDRGVTYVVKPQISSRVTFSLGDVLDDGLVDLLPDMDVVFAQNFLFHLEPPKAAQAFENLCRILGPRGVMFLDGTDLPLRQRLTKKFGLDPLDWQVEQIHNEARWARGEGYPDGYWGLEPFMMTKRDWCRRYSTIFIKNGA